MNLNRWRGSALALTAHQAAFTQPSRSGRLARTALATLSTLLLLGCASPVGDPPPAPAPRALAVTAHPLATEAALAMLRRGGSAVDAAIAAQLVLGLVEPQSSGLGGGAVALHWQAAPRRLTSWDALSAAPSRATAALTLDTDGSTLPAAEVQRGGRSVGVPGVPSLLEALHRQHGRLPWATLFEPAIHHAEAGFPMPPYLHALLSGANAARDHTEFLPLYFDERGRVKPVGTTIHHPAYAGTLRALARLGVNGWLRAGAARDLVAAAQRGSRPSLMQEQDLLAYRPEPREPLCAPRLGHRVCVMGPSSFGGIVVLQILGLMEATMPAGVPARWDFGDAAFVHRWAEAGRLAQADRLQHVGDPGFADVPAAALVALPYLAQRARLIDPARAAPRAEPGAPEHADATSQIVVIDGAGNVLTLTTTINLNFGARLMAGGLAAGVVLNNAASNFASAPQPGQHRPNRMQPGKRAVSSMTPTIVFDARGEPLIAGGSAGGAQIVDYVAQSLVEMLANQRSPAEALAAGHVSGSREGVQLERSKAIAALAPALQARGHTPLPAEMRSGLGFARRTAEGWVGAADPRRDGVAAGLDAPQRRPYSSAGVSPFPTTPHGDTR